MTRLCHWLTGLLVGLLLSGAIFAGTIGHQLFITDDGLVDYNANSALTAFRVCGDVTNEENCPINAYVHPSKGPVNEPICTGGPCDPLLEIPSGKTFTIAQIDGDAGIKVAYSEIGAFDMLERASDPAAPTAASGRWKLYFKSGGLYHRDDTGAVIGPLRGVAGSTLTKSLAVFAPTTTESGDVHWYWPGAVTLTRVVCSTDVGTATIQLEERAETTPNTTGTNSLTSSLVCDTGSEVTTSFSDATIAADVPHALVISAVASAPTVVRVHIKATLN